MPRSFIGWLWNTGSCFACFSAVGSGYQKPENYGWIWSTRKNGVLKIYQSKGSNDRLVYLPDDLRQLCCEYTKDHDMLKYQIKSGWILSCIRSSKSTCRLLPSGNDFHRAWEQTPYAREGVLQPTVHSLRHTFVVLRMNEWMKSGVKLDNMMPYLSKYLGHSSPDDTFYYYHQVEEAFSIIKQKDRLHPS